MGWLLLGVALVVFIAISWIRWWRKTPDEREEARRSGERWRRRFAGYNAWVFFGAAVFVVVGALVWLSWTSLVAVPIAVVMILKGRALRAESKRAEGV
jgi:cell division septal protein FtsQ